MTASAELIQLPIIPPLRLPTRQRQTHDHYPNIHFTQHRIYREPYSRQQAILSYNSSGLVTIDPQKGCNVDHYA